MPTKEWYYQNQEKCKAYTRDYYQKHKEEIRTKYATSRTQLKLEVFSHYSNGQPKCAKCGESDLALLTLDHLRNDGRDHRTNQKISAGTHTWYWAKKNNYPPIFQVLCATCNLDKGPYPITAMRKEALTVEDWIHEFFDKSWEACNSCGLMSCQRNEIVCPFRDFKVIPRLFAKPCKENHT